MAVSPAATVPSLMAPRQEKPRVLTPLALTGMAYITVCAGPFGLEPAVGAAGPLPVLLGILLLPFLWGLPQSFITAELSTMMPDNGGYVLWVRRGLGNFAGWMSSYNSVASNSCDLPLYPVLLSQYTAAFATHVLGVNLGVAGEWAVKFGVLGVVTLVNVRGSSSVAALSLLVTLVIMGPILAEPFFPTVSLHTGDWFATSGSVDWSVFLSVLLWNYQGWDGLGCVAGEVSNAKRTYPLAVSAAMVLATISYALPIMVGVSMFPDDATWEAGLFEAIAADINPVLGALVVVGAATANLGEACCMLCNSARAVVAMADRKMVFPWIGVESKVRGSDQPVRAILLQVAVSALLMGFPFDVLVVVDTFFKNVALGLESMAFLALRHNEPGAERPFQVPGGLAGAWAITIPKFAILLFTMATAGTTAWVLCGGANVAFVVAYLVRQRVVGPDATDGMDKAVQAGERHTNNDLRAGSSSFSSQELLGRHAATTGSRSAGGATNAVEDVPAASSATCSSPSVLTLSLSPLQVVVQCDGEAADGDR